MFAHGELSEHDAFNIFHSADVILTKKLCLIMGPYSKKRGGKNPTVEIILPLLYVAFCIDTKQNQADCCTIFKKRTLDSEWVLKCADLLLKQVKLSLLFPANLFDLIEENKSWGLGCSVNKPLMWLFVLEFEKMFIVKWFSFLLFASSLLPADIRITALRPGTRHQSYPKCL